MDFAVLGLLLAAYDQPWSCVMLLYLILIGLLAYFDHDIEARVVAYCDHEIKAAGSSRLYVAYRLVGLMLLFPVVLILLIGGPMIAATLLVGVICVKLLHSFIVPFCSLCWGIITRLTGLIKQLLKSIIDGPQGYVTFRYRLMGEGIGFCSGDCAICLMEFEEEHNCAMLDKCRHTFHHDCIRKCLAMSTRCPLCYHSAIDWERIREL